jgi:hypothetical protein
MKKLKINIEGKFEGEKISSKNTDISEIKSFITDIENLIRGDLEGNKPKVVIEKFKSGSLIFESAIEESDATNLIFSNLSNLSNELTDLSKLGQKSLRVLDKWQNLADTKEFKFEIESKELPQKISISPDTNFNLKKNKTIKSEIILSGLITDIGGKSTPNIHITTKNFGEVIVACTKEQLKKDDVNRIYKRFSLRTSSIIDIKNNEIKSAELIEFLSPAKKLNEHIIDQFISESNSYWEDVEDPVEWVRELRGEYD